MITRTYQCDMCRCVIASDVYDRLDGVPLKFYETSPGCSAMKIYEGGSATADMHICGRCWRAFGELSVTKAVEQGAVIRAYDHERQLEALFDKACERLAAKMKAEHGIQP